MKRLLLYLLISLTVAAAVYADIDPEPQQAGARVVKQLSRSIHADSTRCWLAGTAACTTMTFDGAFGWNTLNFSVTGDTVDINIVPEAMNGFGMWVPQDTLNITTSGYHLEWVSCKAAAWNRIRLYGNAGNGLVSPTQVDSLMSFRLRGTVR